jgi:hypothetical protein
MSILVIGPQENVAACGLHLDIAAPGAIDERTGRRWLQRQRRTQRREPNVRHFRIEHAGRRGGIPRERVAIEPVTAEGKTTRLSGLGRAALAVITIGAVAETEIDQQIVRAVVSEWRHERKEYPAI